MERKTIFTSLNGTRAQVLVVAGLALTLFAPLIPQFRLSRVNSARTAYDNAEALIELEMEEIKREQERQNKQDNVVLASMTYEQRQVESAALQKRQAELQRVADDKREALKKQYDRTQLKRRLLLAQRDAAGMPWHSVIGWIGSLALIIGLLTLTVLSEGMTQKIYLVVLLLVLFSALSGVRVDFLAAGQMGGDGSSIVDGLRRVR
jgi:hypothetical protein